jgi:hypothetical protein
MPQPRRHATNADKTRAYRARKRELAAAVSAGPILVETALAEARTALLRAQNQLADDQTDPEMLALITNALFLIAPK